MSSKQQYKLFLPVFLKLKIKNNLEKYYKKQIK